MSFQLFGAEISDWSISANPTGMPALPAAGSIAHQSPPDFSWPFVEGAEGYEVELIPIKGPVVKIVARRNWLLWPHLLQSGDYQWRVRVVRKQGVYSPWSAPRRFTVAADAAPFVVPSSADMLARARSYSRPRSLPHDAEFDSWRSTLVAGERKAAYDGLLQRVKEQMLQPLPGEPGPRADTATAVRDSRAIAQDIHQIVYPVTRHLLEAGLAWVVGRDPRMLAEARRAAGLLASWDPFGSTGFSSQDQEDRVIAVSLSYAYDWLYTELDEKERAAILSAVKARTGEIYKHYLGDARSMERFPFDSHGWGALGNLALISAIMAGEDKVFDEWFVDAVPGYLSSISPWGREDGGFGNGTAYAMWDIEGSLLAWDTLGRATGVDVYKKPWVAHIGDYLRYFLPPGTPAGLFGDGAEDSNVPMWARLAKAYAVRVPTRENRWYAQQWSGEDSTELTLLLAPVEKSMPTMLPDRNPNALFLPSIGWAAMHSDLADRNRTSVYFKASPYGSFNHSHADQNSFVVFAKGVPLLIDSGYYDWYESPHWEKWYKQTIAHNAITFDDGQGQTIDDKGARGEITRFSVGTDIDVATGDATMAYGGALTKAIRSLVYIRADTLLVYDVLESGVPRKWEWNLHALDKIEQGTDRMLLIRHGGASLCISQLAGPETYFTQSDRFAAPPDPGVFAKANSNKAFANQWHGALVAKTKTGDAHFLMLIRVGCRPASDVHVKNSEEKLMVEIDGQKLLFGPQGFSGNYVN